MLLGGSVQAFAGLRRVLLGAAVVACGVSAVFALRPLGALASANLNWAAGIGAALPANADLAFGSGVSSVSCASAGDCSAVGDYSCPTGNQGLLMTETAGAWAQGVQAPLPDNAASFENVELHSVDRKSVV